MKAKSGLFVPKSKQANAAEQWFTTQHSASLSGRRSRDTVPEMQLRRALHRRGLRYRVHTRIGERLTLDIDFTRVRVAVFVDGCYWHGCPKHPRTPSRGPNARAWMAKFDSVAERERRAARLLEERGYHVLRIRECEIRFDPEAAAQVLDVLVRSRTLAARRSRW